MLTSAGMPSDNRCQDFSICLNAAFSFAFCGSLLLCSEHHFCAPLIKITAATTLSQPSLSATAPQRMHLHASVVEDYRYRYHQLQHEALALHNLTIRNVPMRDMSSTVSRSIESASSCSCGQGLCSLHATTSPMNRSAGQCDAEGVACTVCACNDANPRSTGVCCHVSPQILHSIVWLRLNHSVLWEAGLHARRDESWNKEVADR